MIGWFKYAKKLPSLNAKDINIGLSFKSENQGLGIKKLLSEKAVFIFIIIRFILDPIFYFYMFWIPAYLSDVHGLSLNLIGNILWIPFMALGIANIFGGWISDYVYNKTGNLDFSRKIIMGIAALLTIPLIFTGTINSYIVILILMVLAFFAHGLWITNYITAIGDIYGKYNTSSIVGFSGTAGAVSSMIINPLTGLIVSTWSYNPLWIYAGIMYPVAFIILLFFIPKIKPMSLGK
jgi:ACS family hexuronate transporter-like MFS transporter